MVDDTLLLQALPRITEEQLELLKKTMFEISYPVGSYFLTEQDGNPNTIITGGGFKMAENR